ncbi:hypothetical protein T4A_13191 [Trichinella pseudospiralis]|uniref:Uncharacterized protein n=1 Tax=Trichinella pseudospiralis TaxID=6337 RepID=A0A0V0Y5Z0_TRIPS|nr:hypothetical protein T4E_12369 [Trichinella pseudospiralis]KRY71881.1 hypothetical protein T4A_13191 [Trichinella pseudospiralis]
MAADDRFCRFRYTEDHIWFIRFKNLFIRLVLADVSSLNTAGIDVSYSKLCFVKTPSFHFFKTYIYLHYNSFHDLSDASLPLSGRLSI